MIKKLITILAILIVSSIVSLLLSNGCRSNELLEKEKIKTYNIGDSKSITIETKSYRNMIVKDPELTNEIVIYKPKIWSQKEKQLGYAKDNTSYDNGILELKKHLDLLFVYEVQPFLTYWIINGEPYENTWEVNYSQYVIHIPENVEVIGGNVYLD